MTNYITPAGATSVGALSISIFSGVYLNNRINNLEKTVNESDAYLSKLIKKVREDDPKKIINEIKKDVNNHIKTIDQLKKSVKEVLEYTYTIDQQNQKLNQIISYLEKTSNFRYNDESKYDYYSDDDYDYEKNRRPIYRRYRSPSVSRSRSRNRSHSLSKSRSRATRKRRESTHRKNKYDIDNSDTDISDEELHEMMSG